jgi:transcriptional regulator with XRE-family HTH domain
MYATEKRIDWRLGMSGETFGAWLGRAWRAAGFETAEAFAWSMGKSPSQLSEWVSGKRKPSWPTLEKMSEQLDIPVAEIAARLHGGKLAQNGHADGSERVPGILDRAHEKLVEKLERDIRKELEVIEEEDGEAAADDLAEIMAGAYSSNTRAILAARRRERERQRAMKT